MFDEPIFFIQEEDIVCFFSHQYCLIEKKKSKTKNKKDKMKLRECCSSKCFIGVV